MSSKADLRKQMRRQRRGLSAQQRRASAEQMAYHVAGSALFRRSRHIAGYVANDGELDPMPLVEIAWAMQKICYLPVLDALHPSRLWFTPYFPDSELVPNRFGIPEPKMLRRRRVPPWRLDLMLVPLVGFDSDGNRLGMGGGFYDQTLAFLQRRSCWKKPRLLGVAYDFQQVNRLPVEPWDIPLDGIATASCIHVIDRGRTGYSGV